MFKEKDFFKEYPAIKNPELIVEIVYKWPKFVPALKNNENCICGEMLSENESYSLKLDLKNETLTILCLKYEKIYKLEIPEYINEYLFMIFYNYELLIDLDDFINLEENNHLYTKFNEIIPAIDGALFTSLMEGKANNYNWCQINELTKQEFTNLVPELVNIAYNCNKYAFTKI